MGTNKPWKEWEREVARRMGGRRIGPSGVDTNDVEHEEFAIECKYRKTLPSWLKDALRQADKGDDRTPVVFAREKHGKHDMAIMRAKDFFDWFGIKEEKDIETC